MEEETIVSMLLRSGAACAIIISLAFALKLLGLKLGRQGSADSQASGEHHLAARMLDVSMQSAQNDAKVVEAIARISEMMMTHGEKLDQLNMNLAVAISRQVTSKDLVEMERRIMQKVATG